MSNAIKEEIKRKPVMFSRLYKSPNQKEKSLTLEVKQEITKLSYYPSKKYNNNLQDSLFNESEFGTESKPFSSKETRVAWINVPSHINEEQAKAKLLNNKNSCIYKILSNYPILDENQERAITTGLKTIDDFALNQAVRYPDSHEKGGELILDASGNIQYKRTFYSAETKADIDLRGNGKEYAPEELLEEIHGAVVYENQGWDDFDEF
jgi:hypothetical protein